MPTVRSGERASRNDSTVLPYKTGPHWKLEFLDQAAVTRWCWIILGSSPSESTSR